MSLYKDKEAAFERIFETLEESETDEAPSLDDANLTENQAQQETSHLQDSGDDSVAILEEDDEPLILEQPSSPEIIENDAIRIENNPETLHDIITFSDEEDGDKETNIADNTQHSDDDDDDIRCFSSEFISFTLQDGNRKNTREIQFSKTDKMFKWKQKYAIELNYKVDEIRLCFDGEVIDDDATPEEADLENGFRIDVHKISPV